MNKRPSEIRKEMKRTEKAYAWLMRSARRVKRKSTPVKKFNEIRTKATIEPTDPVERIIMMCRTPEFEPSVREYVKRAGDGLRLYTTVYRLLDESIGMSQGLMRFLIRKASKWGWHYFLLTEAKISPRNKVYAADLWLHLLRRYISSVQTRVNKHLQIIRKFIADQNHPGQFTDTRRIRKLNAVREEYKALAELTG